mmetsp:Transcript_101347/g.217033  ORF Transcript_101347/g.217033 Transcript_101347/m.217033 type:complete len:205 (-) Transcript_101347:17-631(-)
MGSLCTTPSYPFTDSYTMVSSSRAISPRGRHKVVFLDVDGVLHPVRGQEEFSSTCMQQLRYILQATGAEVVLSTSWRLLPFAKEMLEEQMKHWGLRRPIGCTPEAAPARLRKLWRLCGTKGRRARPGEIATWLCEHEEHVDFPRWVAIDDIDMTEELDKHMVRTNKHVGLTLQDAEHAIRWLNSMEECYCDICNFDRDACDCIS